MRWKHPPIIKVYEALGALADGRVHIDGNTAKVYSSTGNKYYDIVYDPAAQAIMANDNGSYYQGYLGYPAIAFLILVGALDYNPAAAELLKGIAWKDINQKFENDFNKTLDYILGTKTEQEKALLQGEAERIDAQLKNLSLSQLGPRIKPPAGY